MKLHLNSNWGTSENTCWNCHHKPKS